MTPTPEPAEDLSSLLRRSVLRSVARPGLQFDDLSDALEKNAKLNAKRLQLQQDREIEQLDLQRRIAEASEAALEAERARTAAAKEDAEAARKEARTSRSHMRISLWFAAGSFLVAVWALIKDQL